VGELRSLDLGGRPVDTRASFPGGGEGTGIEGLRAYLDASRRGEFVENLCRKLLAYALGRSLLPTDDETIDAMRARLDAGGHRFGGWSRRSSPAPSSFTSEPTASRRRSE